MKNINLNRLFYFHTFVQKKSVVEAAKELLISQPALSNQLKQIELDLGIELFSRSSRTLDLTEKGQHLFYFTKRIFETCETMLEELNPDEKPEKLDIKMGISDQIERPFCVQFISKLFHAKQPLGSQKISVSSANNEILLSRLRTGELNFILSTEVTDDEFITPIASKVLPIVLAIPKSYRGHKTPAISSECLDAISSKELGLVMPNQSLKLRATTENFFIKHNIHPKINFEADILAVMIRAVADGIGAGFMPYPYVVNELQYNKIKIAGLPNGYWEEKLWLLVKRSVFTDQTLNELKSVFEQSI